MSLNKDIFQPPILSLSKAQNEKPSENHFSVPRKRWIFLVILCLWAFTLQEMETSRSHDTPKKGHVALVLARGGSKGIKMKNLATVNNRSLICRTVLTILQAEVFSSVWVSTDDLKIAIEAASFGAKIHWRSARSATDSAASILGVEDFYFKHPETVMIGLIQCTSPFIIPNDLREAHRLITKFDLDSVFSVTVSHHLRWRESADRRIEPVNFNPKSRPRRQDWKGEYVENGMFYFFKTNLLNTEHVLQGGRLGVIEIPENRSLEINTEMDLKIAQGIAEFLDVLFQI